MFLYIFRYIVCGFLTEVPSQKLMLIRGLGSKKFGNPPVHNTNFQSYFSFTLQLIIWFRLYDHSMLTLCLFRVHSKGRKLP